MQEQINQLEKVLNELREKQRQHKEAEYRSLPHQEFEVGDFVTDGKGTWGKVGWVENLAIKKPKDSGYMGLSIMSGSRGFGCKRRNYFEHVSEDQLEYLQNEHEIAIVLTGEQIEDLRYRVAHCNTSDSLEVLKDRLSSVTKM